MSYNIAAEVQVLNYSDRKTALTWTVEWYNRNILSRGIWKLQHYMLLPHLRQIHQFNPFSLYSMQHLLSAWSRLCHILLIWWLENTCACHLHPVIHFNFNNLIVDTELCLVSITLEKRWHVQYWTNLTSVYLSVCVSVESVNDGLFHTVELLIQNQTLSLVVDKGSPKSLGKLARPPSVEPNTHLYIGGESTTNTHAHIHTYVWYTQPFTLFSTMYSTTW